MTDKGIFADYQAEYAARGIVTFPIRITREEDGKLVKKPAVRGWRKMGARASAQLVKQFPNSDAFGFQTNARNKITVVDVDTTDEKVLADAIVRHGEPKIIVRTATGKYHLPYRSNGERRKIRPWGDEVPVDVLGEGGYVAGCPSKVTEINGEYQIIQGSFDDIDSLPIARGFGSHIYNKSEAVLPDDIPDRGAEYDEDGEGPSATDGRRNDALFNYCLQQASTCVTWDQVMTAALAFNERCQPPLTADEVVETAKKAWSYEQCGMNLKGRRFVGIQSQDINDLVQEPDTLALLVFLRSHQGPDSEFMISNGLSEGNKPRLSMSLDRLQKARQRLLDLKFIYRTRRGGGWDKRTTGSF
jgi:Bifunctional DNA primase/polymerase, N-terminal/Primase C terminal 1 (PriCT-1)